MTWEYLQPVTIRFGEGVVGELKAAAESLGCKRGLLVSDPFFMKSGLADKIVASSEGVLAGIYSEVSPNPETVEVDACAKKIREENIDFLVALGGGSALDCAKAAGSICFTTDSIRKYHGTGAPMPQKHLPLIAIPTTAGTGSEVTCVSVLSDHELGKKRPHRIQRLLSCPGSGGPGTDLHPASLYDGQHRHRRSLPCCGGLLEPRASADLRRSGPSCKQDCIPVSPYRLQRAGK